MPEWLLQKDKYVPLKEKDAFIDKSILSILYIIGKFQEKPYDKANRFIVNHTLKLLATMALILLISLSRSSSFLIVIGVFILVVIAMLDTINIIHILKVSVGITIFTSILVAPSFIMGNKYNTLLIIFKVMLSITTINIMSIRMRWSEVTGTLKILHIPDLFIFVLDITMKYILILSDFSLNMFYSLKLRSIGHNDKKVASLSGIVGTMFLKSKEMAEDMYAAMECRGFTGEYSKINKDKFKTMDYLFLLAMIGVVAMFVYFDRWR